ncbi:DUF5082 domain-containing protein [Caenorhabditis elegans]|uniref:DUF5082 domain-containing protein n=1 Tax=Caenorhabditis elegans TaxID=6239 RepID=Q9XVY8_CAEEL|nr:DUF5082 domain-containing protein [Caenorhabditis elegans]CAA22466.2 DUF5082 domain-containing protein [Caenorhabditis elegans]
MDTDSFTVYFETIRQIRNEAELLVKQIDEAMEYLKNTFADYNHWEAEMAKKYQGLTSTFSSTEMVSRSNKRVSGAKENGGSSAKIPR